MVRDTALVVYAILQMGCMKVNSKMGYFTVLEDTYSIIMFFMKDNGLKAKSMELEQIITLTVLKKLLSGIKTSRLRSFREKNKLQFLSCRTDKRTKRVFRTNLRSKIRLH